MARKRAQRVKRRMTCELALAGREYRGIVLDLSETGIFVQTEATPAPSERLRIRLHAPDGSEVELEATVARRQVAPPQLTTVVRGGLGLRVDRPPEAYFRLLGMAAAEAQGATARALAKGFAGSPPPAAASRSAPAAPPAAAAPPEPPPEPDPAFRVRVKQSDGPRSRTLTVRARSPSEARKRALAELGGRGWEILSVEAA
jgi:hypothetical protein